MITFDVNVLLAAFDQGHPGHLKASELLHDVRQSGRRFALIDFVLAAFVRLAMNPRVVMRPLRTAEAALAFCAALRNDGNAQVVPIRPSVWAIFDRHARLLQMSHNLIPDAFIAACSVDASLTLATFDRGFARFANLTWLNLQNGQLATNPR
jgi:toxin-antitoxin system PIN domain toxin